MTLGSTVSALFRLNGRTGNEAQLAESAQPKGRNGLHRVADMKLAEKAPLGFTHWSNDIKKARKIV